MPDNVKPRLHQVLDTKLEAEQVARVQQLLQPTAVLTITLHPLHGVRVSIATTNGTPLPATAAYGMLDQARAQVREMELAELKGYGVPPPPPDTDGGKTAAARAPDLAPPPTPPKRKRR